MSDFGKSKFVTAFNGGRDDYQIPAALAEVGMLERLVTDYYTPDAAQGLFDRLGILPNRYSDHIPSRLVSWSGRALLERVYKRLTGRSRAKDWFAVDRSIGIRANEIARRTGAIPFVYSHYAHWAFEGLEDRPRILFQYHPHVAHSFAILKRDFDLFPEVEWSFHTEEDSIPIEQQRPERFDEWRKATGIICSSSFIRNSLIAQGAGPGTIKVVPYGADIERFGPLRPSGACCNFLFVGQGVQRKGLHHLIAAWREARVGDAGLTLVCTRIDPGIKAMLAGTNITLVGRQDAKVLQDYFLDSDIFVMPSLIEGFGLVYLEALAQGMFVIGTANTGLPDLEMTSAAATIIAAGDIPALVTALEDAYGRWRSREMDKSFIRDAFASHSWARFRGAIVSELRTLLEEEGGARSGKRQ